MGALSPLHGVGPDDLVGVCLDRRPELRELQLTRQMAGVGFWWMYKTIQIEV